MDFYLYSWGTLTKQGTSNILGNEFLVIVKGTLSAFNLIPKSSAYSPYFLRLTICEQDRNCNYEKSALKFYEVL